MFEFELGFARWCGTSRARANSPVARPVRAQRRTPRAGARAKQLSRTPGTKTSEKSWKTRSRSAIEMQTY
jgi:hypothetical protein